MCRCRPTCCPQIKEFDRVSTTVVNAYVGPALSRYLRRLEQRLVEAGYQGPILIIQSHGGVAPIAEAARLAAGGVLSGPAGGVAGSRYATQLLGTSNLIPFDMGGTSTDISPDRRWRTGAGQSDRGIGGHRLALHSLDIVSLGAGGGSIGARRCRRHTACRSAERRCCSRPSMLRPRRHRPDSDRRKPRARLSRSGAFPGRQREARRRGRRGGAGSVGRAAEASTASLPPKACIAWSTPTWPRASAWSPSAAVSIRGASRCSRSAAPQGCM